MKFQGDVGAEERTEGVVASNVKSFQEFEARWNDEIESQAGTCSLHELHQ